MAIVLDGTSGATLPVPLAVAQGGTGSTTLTLTSPVIAGTPTGVGVLTSGTAVASTSGTSIDFTGIPSWAKRITVMFNGVSTNGTSNFLVQIGSGSVTTSGYVSGVHTSANTDSSSTAGFNVVTSNAAAAVYSGSVAIILSSTFTYTETGILSPVSISGSSMSGGWITLSGALDRVRITTVNGADLFDAGSINIMYE